MIRRRFFVALLIAIVLVGTNCAKRYNGESYIRSRVVMLQGNNHACSATQIRTARGQDYLLTAGHCAVLAAADGTINAKDDQNRLIPRRILEEDKNSDLLLLEGLPNLPGLAIADASSKVGDNIRAFTHGHAFATFKSEGELFEVDHVQIPLFQIMDLADEARCSASPKYKKLSYSVEFLGIRSGEMSVCVLDIEAYYTRLVITGGSSGGTVVNGWGELAGVVFAGDSNSVFGFVVPLKAIQEFLKPY